MDQVVKASAVSKLIDSLVDSSSEKLLNTFVPYEIYTKLFAQHAAAVQLRHEFKQLLTEQLKHEED